MTEHDWDTCQDPGMMSIHLSTLGPAMRQRVDDLRRRRIGPWMAPPPGARDFPTAAMAAALLRCVVGNPFRPAFLTPAEPPDAFAALDVLAEASRHRERVYVPRTVLTPTVIGLARAARDERPAGEMCQTCIRQTGTVLTRYAMGNAWETCPDCHGTGHAPSVLLDNDRLLVLADALEDAGCTEEETCPECNGDGWESAPDLDDEEADGALTLSRSVGACPRCHGSGMVPNAVLGHLRAGGPHCSECWVLRLILGDD